MGLHSVVYGKQQSKIRTLWESPFFVSNHRGLRQALETLPTRFPSTHILLTGPGGSGRSTFARTAWSKVQQVGRPFVQVSCASLHNVYDLRRLLRQAAGGDLVLESLDLFPPSLLTFWLRELEYMPSVRLLALYECDQEAEGARFFSQWELLFEKWIHIPPLRERPWDIALLVEQTLEGYPRLACSTACLTQLTLYSWPGETAQLVGFVKKMAQQAIKKQEVYLSASLYDDDFSYSLEELQFFSLCEWVREEGLLSMARKWGMKSACRTIEAAILALTLEECLGCARQAAHVLQMPVSTLVNRKKVLGHMIRWLEVE